MCANKDMVSIVSSFTRMGKSVAERADHQWELAVTNSTKSAFCLFKLKPKFFCRYRALGNNALQRRGVKCQLLVKVGYLSSDTPTKAIGTFAVLNIVCPRCFGESGHRHQRREGRSYHCRS